MREQTEILFKSDTMGNLLKMVSRIAPSQANVLILGESGTGKEALAYKLHNLSLRKNKPFVTVNCSALNELMLESELFGHEKGSFEKAYGRKIGLIEVANGGTLFLKEIGRLPVEIQTKLLGFIQEGQFYRMGGTEPIEANVRIVCSTHIELDQEVQRGNFREDLFYRINTLVVSVPSLRRRREDIPMLVQHFLENISGLVKKTISEDAMKVLVKYDWHGNIHQLKNVCEAMLLLSNESMIKLEDVPEEIRNPKNDLHLDYNPNVTLHDLEKRYILQALEQCGGNKTQAANQLGITIKTLYNKLHEYGEFERFNTPLKVIK